MGRSDSMFKIDGLISPVTVSTSVYSYQNGNLQVQYFSAFAISPQLLTQANVGVELDMQGPFCIV